MVTVDAAFRSTPRLAAVYHSSAGHLFGLRLGNSRWGRQAALGETYILSSSYVVGPSLPKNLLVVCTLPFTFLYLARVPHTPF